MSKQYFVVTDVHGFYPELFAALDRAGFDAANPEHIFVSLGDLFDRGSYPLQCLKFVNSLPSDRKILIRGNHEDLMEAAINRKRFLAHDYDNGTVNTALDLSDILFTKSGAASDRNVLRAVKRNVEYSKYLASVMDYYEDAHCVFVHGWIPCRVINPEVFQYEDTWRTGKWPVARWINGMSAWAQGVRVPGKTVFCGHRNVSWGHSRLHKDGMEWANFRSTNPEHRQARFDPFVDEGICALDACTVKNKFVNCVKIDVETGKFIV